MRILINKIKLIWGKIKDLFKVKKMKYEFPNVKVKILEDKINITNNAQTDGKLNEPKSNSKTVSVCENEALVSADEFRAKEVTKATAVLANLEEKIRESQSKLDQDNFHIAHFKNEVNDQLINADGKLSNLKDIFDKEDQQVKNFKRENHLTREPSTLTTGKMLLGFFIIGFLFVVEMIVNSNLLAPAMSRGLAEGRSIAAGVAGLNVFVSFGVGYFALKNFHHIKMSRKIFSQFILAVYLIFIFYLNWALGAYRAIHEATGANALDILAGNSSNVDVSTLQAHYPWTVDLTFTSLILVFIGILFAIISLLDGWLYNDRYPGFGSIGKLRDETKKEIDRLRERLSPQINLKFKNEIRKTNEKKQSIIENIIRKEWTPNVTALQNIFDGYKRFIANLNVALTHTVGEYRRVNETYRNTPAPSYFETDLGKKLSENHNDTKLVFAGYSELYLGKDQIEKQMSTYLNKIEDEGDAYINLINSYHENEVNKKIEDIRNKYNAINH